MLEPAPARLPARSAPAAGVAPTVRVSATRGSVASEELRLVGDLPIPKEIPVRLGRYMIEGELGRGGMGIVLRARQEGLNRPVALKMLLPGAMASEEMVQRFLREARAVGRLQHANIVAVHEVGTFEGKPFFTMDLVSGSSLQDELQAGSMAPREAARVLSAVARAVDHAHERGILHRDLKPANVLLDASGEPKITDFGLAKDMDAKTILSLSGDVFGTPAYMPPEQAQGRIDELDARTDVYALGAILYHMLSGHMPFDGKTLADTLLQVVHEDPIPPSEANPDVDPDLAAIAFKAMEKVPSLRYPTARALADDLDRFLDGEAILARPPSSWRRWKRRAAQHRATAAAVVVALGLLALFAVIGPGIFGSSYEDRLAEALASPDAAVRRAAMETLSADLGTPGRLDEDTVRASVRCAAGALEDTAEPVRQAVHVLLQKFGEQPVVRQEALRVAGPGLRLSIGTDTTESGRVRTLRTIAALGDREATSAVLPLLHDPVAAVRREAVRTLGRLGDQHALGPLFRTVSSDPECRMEAQAAIDDLFSRSILIPLAPGIGAGMQRALTGITQALADQRQSYEEAGMGDALNDPAPKDPALEALEDPDPVRRMQAAYELGRDRRTSALGALYEALGDSDPDAAKAAALAILAIGASDFETKLAKLLRSGTEGVRASAAFALGERRTETAVRSLTEALAEERAPRVRFALLDALARAGGPEAVRYLRQAASSPDPAEAEHARKLLEPIPPDQGS